MKTICPRCKHEWNYKGKAWYITCPVCRKLFKNENREVEE
jgi:tRNA(Ile2) C34 agmatinyltransferase TiaS